MRDSLAVLSVAAVLCALTACGGTGDQQSPSWAQSVATSRPMLEAKDALLVAEVKSRLVAINMDTASQVSVTAVDGSVVLRGQVRDRSEIRRLSDAAVKVKGVRSVRTNLRVNPKMQRTSETLRDVSLATEVVANLAVQTGINVLSVKARAFAGVITLQGRVRSAAMKSVMQSTATKTPGVKKVIDELEVTK